jgi:hypothetical protein
VNQKVKKELIQSDMQRLECTTMSL